MRLALISDTLILSAVQAQANVSKYGERGSGGQNSAVWLLSAESEIQGRCWIWGLCTGLNLDRMVTGAKGEFGGSIHGLIIVDEIKKRCLISLSNTVVAATAEVLFELKKARK